MDRISSTYIILEKGGGGAGHLRTFYAVFVSFHLEDFQRFPIFINNSDYSPEEDVTGKHQTERGSILFIYLKIKLDLNSIHLNIFFYFSQTGY